MCISWMYRLIDLVLRSHYGVGDALGVLGKSRCARPLIPEKIARGDLQRDNSKSGEQTKSAGKRERFRLRGLHSVSSR